MTPNDDLYRYLIALWGHNSLIQSAVQSEEKNYSQFADKVIGKHFKINTQHIELQIYLESLEFIFSCSIVIKNVNISSISDICHFKGHFAFFRYSWARRNDHVALKWRLELYIIVILVESLLIMYLGKDP